MLGGQGGQGGGGELKQIKQLPLLVDMEHPPAPRVLL